MNSMCLGFLVALTVVATIDGALDLSSNGAPRLPVYEDQCTHPFRAVSGGRCYFLSYGSLHGSWEAAQQVCSWLHPTGRLAEFESVGELIDVTAFLNEDVTSCSVWTSPGPWIGGVEVGSSGEFVWRSTNASILGDNWADNEPNSPTSGDAIAMDCENEFKWRDLERTTDLPFMCEADANPPPVTWGCPEGFQMVGRGCYHFGTEQLNFDNSRTYCHGLGGKLLEFETADEMFTFNDYFTENPPSSCSGHWIGGEERGNSQQFQWISSARPVLFYNWLDYPNSDSDQGLALECPRSPKWKWNDFPKSRTYNPICETDLIEI